jgi:hypothetical protein
MAASANGNSRRQFWITTTIAAFFIVTAIVSYVVQITSIGSIGTQNTDSIKALQDSNYNLRIEQDKMQARLIVQEAALKEIETQFCASDIVRNLMHANELRDVAMLHEKVFGARMPTDNAYYPTVCNRPVQPQ